VGLDVLVVQVRVPEGLQPGNQVLQDVPGVLLVESLGVRPAQANYRHADVVVTAPVPENLLQRSLLVLVDHD